MSKASSLLFGDIFRYNEREYIFLAKTEEVVYAAQILSKEDTAKIDGMFRRRMANGTFSKVEGVTLYCYVILETKEFKDRCAHLHNAAKDVLELMFEKLPITLDKIDLQHIKEEITKKKAISIELKELVKDIQI